ncbi:MAG: mandelate racemase/muconate lactonizing enzyme family protein [Spirochaetaceae bacterium]
MKITQCTSTLYRLPLKRRLSDSRHGILTQFEVVMVRLNTEEGIQGVGYTYTIGLGGGAIKALIDDALAPLLIGRDPTEIEALWEAMWWKLHYVGRGGPVSFAVSALDLGLWDLLGKKRGEPLWRMLGGHNPQVVPYAGGVDLQFSLEELLDQTRKNLAAGYRALKMKVGREDYREDVERVAAVRELIGPDVTLMVDANMQWTTSTAISAARAFAPYELYWFEEPTIPDDFAAHATIQSEGGIPVAAGENLHTVYEFRHLIEAGGVSFVEPDVSNCGGVTGWMRVANLAYTHNLPTTSHGVHEIHLQLLAAIPNKSFVECHGFGLERYMKNPPQMIDGVMRAGELPGHGVDFDWAKLEEHNGRVAPA